MKKNIWIILLALFLVAALGSCNPSEDSNQDTDSTESTTEETTRSEETGGEDITAGEDVTSGEEDTSVKEDESGVHIKDEDDETGYGDMRPPSGYID